MTNHNCLSNATEWSTLSVVVTIVICNHNGVFMSSGPISGKISYCLSQIFRFACPSNDLALSPEKSLTLGKTNVFNLSKKSKALVHLNVVLNMDGIPALNLKLETAFFDWIICGNWPVILWRCSCNSEKSFIPFLVARDPIHILTTTFSTVGTWFILDNSRDFCNSCTPVEWKSEYNVIDLRNNRCKYTYASFVVVPACTLCFFHLSTVKPTLTAFFSLWR